MKRLILKMLLKNAKTRRTISKYLEKKIAFLEEKAIINKAIKPFIKKATTQPLYINCVFSEEIVKYVESIGLQICNDNRTGVERTVIWMY